MSFEFLLKSDQDPSNFKYDLFIKNWTETGMVLHINFTDPLIVSQGKLFDEALIKVKNRNLFVSQETGKKYPQNDGGIIDQFPRQLGVGDNILKMQQDALLFTSLAQASTIVIVFGYLFIKGNPYDIWTMFFAMQLICYLKVYDTHLPSNAQIYMGYFSNAVEFGIFDPLTYIKMIYPNFSFKYFGSKKP